MNRPRLVCTQTVAPDPIDAVRQALSDLLVEHLDALAVADHHAREATRYADVLNPPIADLMARFAETRRRYADTLTALMQRMP